MGKRKKRLSREARRRQRNRRAAAGIILLILLAAAVFLIIRHERAAREEFSGEQRELLEADPAEGRPAMDVQLLTPNPFSRSQRPLDTIRGIVIHYTANPGSTAQENRDYFEGLKDSQTTYASSHFVIGPGR